ncbi:MAG TPA: hypothetical protein VGJ37_08610 [Pyrinomonadaceae bacterium]|jgi:hypothetical protein
MVIAKTSGADLCKDTDLKIRSITIRLLWFAIGLGVGVIVAVKAPVMRQPEVLVSEKISLDTNVNELISIHSKQDAATRRAELVSFIWGANGLPKNLPANVEKAIQDDRYSDLTNLKQIDRLIVPMEWGVTSAVYHFVPAEANGKLLIYHGGHDGDFIIAKDLIAYFLKNGFAVMALSMPLEDPNNRPVVELQHIGKVQLSFHDQLKLLKMKSGHPVQLFLTPVSVALNYAQSIGYKSFYMTGVSGGGWTTTLYSAIDPRINRSFPAAGSLPLHLREDRDRFNSAQRPADWGDYEQTIPELHAIANYLDLYILGSFGEQRRQLQILNKYDPCCFAGESFKAYEAAVNERVKTLGGGRFAVYLDTTNREHSISADAFEAILNGINAD